MPFQCIAEPAGCCEEAVSLDTGGAKDTGKLHHSRESFNLCATTVARTRQAPKGPQSTRAAQSMRRLRKSIPEDIMKNSLDQLITDIAKLPEDWHKAGSVGQGMLRAVVRHIGDQEISHSMETGSGKTTLLFSHLSRDHKVFALEMYGETATNSVLGVKVSPLFNKDTVEFIEGPTQRTLPRYEFKHKLQLALIDGPHGYPFPDLEY